MATAPRGSEYEPRELFIDEYGRLTLALRNWQLAFAAASATALIAVAGLVYLSTRSRLVPYVVTVDHQGWALASPTALLEAEPFAEQDRIIRYEIAGFIRDARSVIGDPLAEAAAIDRVKARAVDPAARYITHWYNDDDQAHDPYELAKHERVTVAIDSILRETPGSTQARFDAARREGVALGSSAGNISTWQLSWTEQSWKLSGDPGPQTHWQAELTVTLAPLAELDGGAPQNPLGFTVQEISWTEQRQ